MNAGHGNGREKREGLKVSVDSWLDGCLALAMLLSTLVPRVDPLKKKREP